MSTTITRIRTEDRRFDLGEGAGSDAVHTDPFYSYAVCRIETDGGHAGAGITLHLGDGNELICQAIELLAAPLAGREVEELMAGWGETSRLLANHPRLRWLGPHKGVVGLAMASISTAVFDLWAKVRGVPAWRLLLDLTPEAFVNLLDLSYLGDVLSREDALGILRREATTRASRETVLREGYAGYDTSVGWFNYPDEMVQENTRRAIDAGFTALKLKVGSADLDRDVRRAGVIREAAGDGATIMVDANQSWDLPRAIRAGLALKAAVDPYWIEEPTHPDDVLAHQTLARALAPTRIALGEHVPNRVMFKNFLQAGALGICQVDATRVSGVEEFLAVSLLCRKMGVPVVPHVGDMGQIHQHLVLVNHIGLGLPNLFLEYIPHLRDRFVHPARVEGGRYATPEEPGLATDLKAG